jgi:phage FluMu protein gp41
VSFSKKERKMFEVKLNEGIKIGDKTYTTVHLDKLQAGEAMDAADEAESIKMAEDGKGGLHPIFVTSPARATAERIRRMIKKLSDPAGESMSGPVQYGDLRKMDEGDYRRLTAKADEIENLYLAQETDAQGREESAKA